MRLATEEYRRTSEAVASLQPDQWELHTDCPDWTVRELVAHIAGMAAMVSTPWESSRQAKAAGRKVAAGGGLFIDALTGLQVAERSSKSAQELAAEVRRIAPRAARGRRLMPGFLRGRLLEPAQDVGGVEEWWTLGFLVDTVLTRDPWMHRIDLARATGQGLHLTAEHDGAIVDDVVREWASRHGQAYRLRLTGPAGGTWSWGRGDDGGPEEGGREDAAELDLDAVEFCRILSGRTPGEGLLSVKVPF
jgi:uncharacterized protein (TIGR03083 family)